MHIWMLNKKEKKVITSNAWNCCHDRTRVTTGKNLKCPRDAGTFPCGQGRWWQGSRSCQNVTHRSAGGGNQTQNQWAEVDLMNGTGFSVFFRRFGGSGQAEGWMRGGILFGSLPGRDKASELNGLTKRAFHSKQGIRDQGPADGMCAQQCLKRSHHGPKGSCRAAQSESSALPFLHYMIQFFFLQVLY